MEKIIRDFVWSGGSYKPGNNLVKWEWTALPTYNGGLWRFTQEKDVLWRRVIASIYGVEALGWKAETSIK